MNENKHTPEPWSVDPDSTDYCASILDANGADTILLGDYADWWMTKANARRVVACVNACAGIPTYQLTAENDIPTNLGEVIDAIRDQRDILLAALDRLAFAAECRDNTTGDQCRLIEVRAELAAAAANARAAIAAATGTNITATIKCAANCGADVPVMAKDEGEDHLCHYCGRDAG